MVGNIIIKEKKMDDLLEIKKKDKRKIATQEEKHFFVIKNLETKNYWVIHDFWSFDIRKAKIFKTYEEAEKDIKPFVFPKENAVVSEIIITEEDNVDDEVDSLEAED